MPRALTSGIEASSPSTSQDPAVVSVKVGGRSRVLRIGDIQLVTACENYTQLSLAENKRLIVRRTMRQWADLLPKAQFARVHRGLFVNLACVGYVARKSRESLCLHFFDGAPPVEVKRRYWPTVRDRLDAWRASAAPVSPAPRNSIAVLPFANVSRAPDDEVFCDGITEELLNTLAKIPGLQVAARTSAFFFKGLHVPVREIARQLGVAFVVAGSVRRLRSRVRITVQLISATDGFNLWSDNFERELTDVLAVQDDIARLIASRLHLKLRAAPRLLPTVDPAAHWLVLEGRHFWNLRTAENFARAEKAFASALALDAGFAAAHAGLADVCVVRAMYRLADGARDVGDDLARTEAETTRALSLDLTLAEPHAALGFARFHTGQLAASEPHFAQAFALNPNYATGRQFFAWTLAARGLLDRALEEYALAIALDPLSFINIDRHAAMLALAGRHSEALAANERAAVLRPDLFVGNLSQRAPILLALGRKEEALAAARVVRGTPRHQPFRRNSDADALFVLHACDRREEAEAYGAELLAEYAADNYLRGFVLAAVGRQREALPFLAFTPPIMLPQLYWSPLWNGVRHLPEFGQLITRLGRDVEYRAAST